MNAPAAIELDHLTKIYGEARAVDDVSLAVPAGSVYGFLGPNGAGKSTTLGILAGLDFPTSGTARILGNDVVRDAAEVRRVTGVLPDVPGFYAWMTAVDVLTMAGRLFRLPKALLRERIEIVLDLAGLTDANGPVGGFSRGMKQRLGIAQALINAPPVLLLDEPTSALDPIGRKDVLDVVSALAGRTTIFFSSHILEDVERICDRVAILDHGRILLESSIGDLLSSSTSQRITIELGSPVEAETLAQLLHDEPWARQIDRRLDRVESVATDLHIAQQRVPALISVHGLSLRRFEIEQRSLEDVFVDLVRPEER
jgi:ABC-2 type transport system ATP-binding protein